MPVCDYNETGRDEDEQILYLGAAMFSSLRVRDDARQAFDPECGVYQLRAIPQEVWDALNARCAAEKIPRRSVILKALRQYLGLPPAGDGLAMQLDG